MGPRGIAGVVGAPGPMVSIGHLAEYVPLYNVNNLIPIFFYPTETTCCSLVLHSFSYCCCFFFVSSN